MTMEHNGRNATCLNCSELFMAYRPQHRFCSTKCHDAWHNNRRRKTPRAAKALPPPKMEILSKDALVPALLPEINSHKVEQVIPDNSRFSFHLAGYPHIYCHNCEIPFPLVKPQMRFCSLKCKNDYYQEPQRLTNLSFYLPMEPQSSTAVAGGEN